MNTLIYIGHSGSINLNENYISLLSGHDFFNYTMGVDSESNIDGIGSYLNRITLSNRTYQFSVLVSDIEKLSYIEETFSFDRVNELPGKLYLNGVYIECYVTNFTLRSPLRLYKEEVVDIEVTALKPFWTKEEKYEFIKFDDSETLNDKEGLSFPFSFPFGFKQSRNNRTIINRNPQKSAVDFVFYGPLTKVDIVIGLHRYNVNAELLDNERLVISQRGKTIEKITVAGDRINMMNYRNKEESVFEPIMPGEHIVSFNGDYSFEIIVFDERSVAFWN